jgi:hypothetical protein
MAMIKAVRCLWVIVCEYILDRFYGFNIWLHSCDINMLVSESL